jgi:ring-1,2-phenylacetyl-CoA epoxidase subunit PaaE
MSVHFHPLPVAQVTPETREAIRVRFAVPPALRDAYAFKAGQFVTLRAKIDGAKVQRAYSICSPTQQYAANGTFEVGIKRVEGGVFSSWAHAQLQNGATLDVMPPDGRFVLATPSPAPAGEGWGEGNSAPKHILAVAAGSGITPMLSLIHSTLAANDNTQFTLLYGNRSVSSVMFLEALEDIKDRWPTRFAMHHVLSRQAQEIALFNGRLDTQKIAAFLRGPLAPCRFDAAYICGPESMIDAAQAALLAHGLPQAAIHSERFVSPENSQTNHAGSMRLSSQNALEKRMEPASSNSESTQLTVLLDGKEHVLAWQGGQAPLLDTALAAGLDLPFSCKGGVCCTCRAKILHGQVRMDKNFTLEQWEIDQGFVLTCQARPLSPTVKVSYDDR